MNEAIKQAMRSHYKFQMGCVIRKGSKTLGVGYNRTNRYQSKVKTQNFPGSLHAEIAAVLDALRKHDASKLKGSTVTVVRLGKNDKLMLAYPCKSCYHVLANLGIKEIRFSNESGEFSSIRV